MHLYSAKHKNHLYERKTTMKKTNKLFALILAIVMIVSLAACSKQPAATPTQNAPEPTAAELSNKIDLKTTKFKNADPFSEGLAWVNYMECSTLINKEGEIIYQADGTFDSCTPVRDGVCFYQKASDYGIIDKEGKVLYRTKSNTDDEFEQILAYGDGNFMILRHSKGFNKDEYSLGAIDKDGKETVAFQTVTPDYQNSFIESKWSYAGDGLFVNVNTIYEVYDVSAGKFIDHRQDENQNWGFVSKHDFRSTPQNGKMWILISESSPSRQSFAVFDLRSGEIGTKISCNYDEKGKTSSAVFGTYCVSDGVYYDLNGEEIAKVDLYKDQVIDRGEFLEDGQEYLIIEDTNHDTYLTYVNKSGEKLFEPMKITTGKFDAQSCIHGARFAMTEKGSNAVIIYDSNGKEVYRIDNVDNANVRSVDALDDDYAIIGGQYYFFR